MCLYVLYCLANLLIQNFNVEIKWTRSQPERKKKKLDKDIEYTYIEIAHAKSNQFTSSSECATQTNRIVFYWFDLIHKIATTWRECEWNLKLTVGVLAKIAKCTRAWRVYIHVAVTVEVKERKWMRKNNDTQNEIEAEKKTRKCWQAVADKGACE